MRRFKFLDLVCIKGRPECLALVVQSNLSAFGETIQCQWFDGTPDTIMHADNLVKAHLP